MEKVIYRISLDVGRNGIQKTIQGIETGDVYAREIRITLRNGKENYELPTDNSVVAYMKVVKPSTSEGDPNACTIENGEIVYSVNATDFTEVGTTILQLELVESSPTGMTKRLIAPRFAVEVWESEIVAPSTTSQSSYTQLTSSLAQARAYYNKRFKEITVDDDNVVHVIFYNGTSTTDYTSDSLNAITGKIVDLEEDVDDLTTAMSGKADKTYVDSQDALKANKTYVDTELAKKANSYNPSTSGSFNHNGNIYADDLYYMDSNDSLDGGGFVIETHTSVKNAISGINTSLGNKVNKSNPNTTGSGYHYGNYEVDGTLKAKKLKYFEDMGMGMGTERDVQTVLDNHKTWITTLGATLTQVESDVEDNTSAITQNTEDIEELKNRPSSSGIITTSTSPLPNCSASSIVGIDVDGCSTQYISPNLIKCTLETSTLGGVTCTKNSDGTYTLNGTASANHSFYLVDDIKPFLANYVGKTLRVVGGASSNIRLAMTGWKTDSTGIFDFGEGVTIENISDVSSFTNVNFRILVMSGTVCNNVVVKPMVTTNTSATKNDYQKYTGTPTPTNPIAIVDASGDVIARTVNLLDGSGLTTKTANGITATPHYTNDELDYISIVGTATANTYLSLIYKTVPSGSYILSGCPSGGSTSTHCLYINKNTAIGINSNVIDIGEGKAFTTTAEGALDVKMQITNGENLNLKIYPMVRYASISDSAYAPYASNKITLPTLRSVGTVKDELIVNADGGSKTVSVLDYEITEISDVIASPDYGNYVNVTLPSNVQNIAPMHSAFKGCTYQDRIADANAYRVYVSSTTSGNTVTFRIPKGILKTKAEMLAMVQLSHLRCSLATPTTTTLTASEVSAIRQLQTYSGTTIVDSALDVKSVTYHADTKAYIDGRTDYSYSDTVIGKWADGKDLHRMVISTTTPNASSAVKVISNVVNSTNHNIKRIDGTLVENTNIIAIPFIFSTSLFGTMWVNPNGINMLVSSNDYINKPCEIIVEYTLTDESTQSDDGISVLSEGGDE